MGNILLYKLVKPGVIVAERIRSLLYRAEATLLILSIIST